MGNLTISTPQGTSCVILYAYPTKAGIPHNFRFPLGIILIKLMSLLSCTPIPWIYRGSFTQLDLISHTGLILISCAYQPFFQISVIPKHIAIGFGVLPSKRDSHPPGTVLLVDEVQTVENVETVISHSLKHGTGINNHIVLVPQPSNNPNDPLVRRFNPIKNVSH